MTDTSGRSEIVRRRLEKSYGRPGIEDRMDPLSTLVHTILSQNTTDITSDRAWKALRRKYRTMKSLAEADRHELAETVRMGGLADIKAGRIIQALNDIRELTGRLSLDFLRDMDEQEADRWLSQLKGVGPKTRAIVLLFSLDKTAFPVDTHIFRVTKRLGLVRPSADREEAQERMAELSEPADYFSYHVNIIEHGRNVCAARRPKCYQCILYDVCNWSEKKEHRE